MLQHPAHQIDQWTPLVVLIFPVYSKSVYSLRPCIPEPAIVSLCLLIVAISKPVNGVRAPDIESSFVVYNSAQIICQLVLFPGDPVRLNAHSADLNILSANPLLDYSTEIVLYHILIICEPFDSTTF